MNKILSFCCVSIPTVLLILFLYIQYFYGEFGIPPQDSDFDPTGTVDTSNLFWHTIDVNFNRNRSSSPIELTVILNNPDLEHFKNDNQKPAIIFLHGFPETALISWHQQFQFFHQKGYRIIAPDQRGYNTSFKSDYLEDFSVSNLRIDIIQLLDFLKIEKCFLVGHDWGGLISWALVDGFSERFEKATIINVPHPDTFKKYILSSWTQIKKSWYIFYFQIPYFPEQKFMKNDFSGLKSALQTGRNGPKKYSLVEKNLLLENWKIPKVVDNMINYYRATLLFPFFPANSRISLPVQILWGAKDIALEEFLGNFSFFEKCNPENGFFKKFENLSHWPQHDDENEINNEILKFLKG